MTDFSNLPDNFAGTLKRELFHLLLLNNIQPTPPWLDEGLAALYEVSVFRGDSVIGIDNWRGKLIRDNWDYIIGNREYSIIKVLTNYNWKVASQTGEPQIIDQVVINAISRYFFLFLQEKKLLFNYVLSIRNCTPDNQKGYYLTRLEEVTGKPSTVLDSEFNTWLKQKVFSAKY